MVNLRWSCERPEPQRADDLLQDLRLFNASVRMPYADARLKERGIDNRWRRRTYCSSAPAGPNSLLGFGDFIDFCLGRAFHERLQPLENSFVGGRF